MTQEAPLQTTLNQTHIEDLSELFTPSVAPNAQQVVTPNIFSKEIFKARQTGLAKNR